MLATYGPGLCELIAVPVQRRARHRVQVETIQSALDAVPQIDCPVRHYFAPGLYAREITIPVGILPTTVVGAIHKTESIVVLSKGRMIVGTIDGPLEIVAPYTLTVRPGDKNAVHALEECVWTNFFPNPDNETDPDVLIERLTESLASDLIGGHTNKQLAANKAAELER